MSKIKHYIGIDPGKTGGIVVLSQTGQLVSFHKIPTIGKDIDTDEFAEIFKRIIKNCETTGSTPHACIEKVHALFGASAGSTFNFGYCVGLIDGVIKAYQIPFSKIQPKEWQSYIWQSDEIEREPDKISEKTGRKITGKVKTKIVSLKAFKRIFPTVDFRTSTKIKNQPDGLVDAILIAEACRRLNH